MWVGGRMGRVLIKKGAVRVSSTGGRVRWCR